ncbi:hypothetical protein [Planotetraspora kaengkrachanensis]|uniref:hypothetical protein n=1 Tax=Planotetraspora kaengkrachanensis TaxID=575193 RepID=UPI003570DC8A
MADTHTYYVLAGNTPVLVHNCDRVQFAHGTSRASSANIRANGLSQSDGLANLNCSQHPGSFFTSRLDPIDGNPAVSNAASWRARAARSAGDDGVSVMVFSLPKSIVRQLEEAGHLTDHPAIFEPVFHPDGFALFNRHVRWDDAFEIPSGNIMIWQGTPWIESGRSLFLCRFGAEHGGCIRGR